MSSRVLTAVAWPYANGPRHIGHVSGFGVPSDVFSRYMRMSGHDVLMVSGTDEHGTPISVQAEREGMTTRELADKYNRVIVEDLQGLGLSYDLFTRTTTLNHYAVVQDLFTALHRNGYVVARVQMGAISPSTGRTLPDRYIEGTCPICGYPSARGDQCDNCGNQLDPIDLINPKSRINGETPKFVETEHYFLDLPAFAEVLGDWLRKQDHWRTNVQKFSLNLLDDLKPRAITRDLEWGVPIPLPEWRDRPDKKIYVWFDAVIGYLSASIQWAQLSGDPDAWRPFWQEPDSRAYYFMGKDNIVFHAEIWPAMLFGYSGIGAKGGTPGRLGALNRPFDVVSSEFLTMEGKKFSSSRNVVIYVGDMLSRSDADALRYYLAAAGPGRLASPPARGGPRDPGRRLPWGGVRPPQQRRAGRRLGQPGEPDHLDDRQEPRLDPGRGRVDRPRPDAAGLLPGRLRHRRRADLEEPAEGRARRGDAGGRRGEQVPVRHRAVEAEELRPGPDGLGAAHHPAGGRRPQDAADAVPADHLAEGVPGTRRHRDLGRDARAGGGGRADRGRFAVVLGADRQLPDPGPVG